MNTKKSTLLLSFGIFLACHTALAQSPVRVPHLKRPESAVEFQRYIKNPVSFEVDNSAKATKSIDIAITSRSSGLVGKDTRNIGARFGVKLDPFDAYVSVMENSNGVVSDSLWPLSAIKHLKEGNSILLNMDGELCEVQANQRALPGNWKMNFERALEGLELDLTLFMFAQDVPEGIAEFKADDLLRNPALLTNTLSLYHFRLALFSEMFGSKRFEPTTGPTIYTDLPYAFIHKRDGSLVLEIDLAGEVKTEVKEKGDHFQIVLNRAPHKILQLLEKYGNSFVRGKALATKPEVFIAEAYLGNYELVKVHPNKLGVISMSFKQKREKLEL